MAISSRLIIFSGVKQYAAGKKYSAHAGFVKEIDIWAKIFDVVIVIAPFAAPNEMPLADVIAYKAENIKIQSIGCTIKTDGIIGKMRLLYAAPMRIIKGKKMISENDVVMARGPDSIGFLGVLLTRYSKVKRFAKYADQWEHFQGEPIGYRIQKMFYRSSRFGGPVQIYGKTDSARSHLVPFFTSSISKSEWEMAGKEISNRPIPPPFRLLFVGRLVPSKGAVLLLHSLKMLSEKGFDLHLDIVGDGPERQNIKKYIHHLGIDEKVTVHGWVGWAELSQFYTQSHCFVHCSMKEGFGKVLIEAMTYALPVVATDVGVSREIIRPPDCGFIVSPNCVMELSDALQQIIMRPKHHLEMGRKGRNRAQQFLLDGLELRYKLFLKQYLGLNV